tara:strand:- start:123881 stop:124759 length:879 start_codon:yes stop_codon:yes gene_type:complete
MKLVMTMVVRDEEDIIADNLRFHFEGGVDEAIVLDNASDDGTRDILSDLAKQYPIRIMDEPGRDFSQGRWMTRLATIARDDLGADWIVPNDADEFWWNGGASLKAAIARTGSACNLLRCHRVNMIQGYDAAVDDKWWKRLTFRVATPDPVPSLTGQHDKPRPSPHFYCALAGKVMVATKNLKMIGEGNHSAVFHTEPVAEDSCVTIYHFPVRSPIQFMTKACNAGAAFAQNDELPKGIGWHTRRWYWLYENHGIEAAMADALPSLNQLDEDVKSGRVVRDDTMIRVLDRQIS